MARDLLLGVDIGTYSSKGVVCASDGRVLATATVEHGLSLPRPGWAEQDADTVWWADLVEITRRLLAGGIDSNDIGAVGVSAIGSCLLPVDAAGIPLRPGILYGIDTRATDEIAWLNETFGDVELRALGGMGLTSQAIGPKILWLRRHEPDVFARAATMATSSSYLVFKLTGEWVMDRHSASHYNPLIDINTMEWDGRFAGPIVELDRLPPLRWANEIAGGVSSAAARATGLRAGTPVSVGTVDAAAEALSVGVVEPGDMMIMYGTTMFFILVTERPLQNPSMWTTAYHFPGTFDVAGGMATSGALTRWFRDQFGQPEMEAERRGGPDAYQALAELAASVDPGSDGVVCLPYFSGERTPINDPDARGVFAGLTLSHTRAHLYRSILEGTAFGVRHNLEAIRAMGAGAKRLVAVGGGAKNAVWLQIVSDVTGVAQIVPERTIGACLGDAFLAGLAAGIIPDLACLARDWVATDRVLHPSPAAGPIYDRLYPVYRDLYRNSKDQLHALAKFSA
jgi:xylulokinase